MFIRTKFLRFSWTSDIKNGIQPPADRVSAVLDMPSPTSVKDLRRAIGLFNWFRKYIQNFSVEVDPMTKLLKKSVKFKWGIEQEQAFKKVKTLLANSPVLAFPKYDLPFYLAVDTSCKGIGYMLYQQHPMDDSSEELRVIRFGSKSLSKWQRSYGPTKLELLGMVTAILDCSMYLRGQKFVVECDHQALKPLFQKQLKGAIYERWIAILQQFNFELRYKPGKDMQVADALSRAPNKSSTTGFESPDQLDPYFPYHTENVGNIITPNGMPFTNLLCSDKSSDTDELQLNNIDILQNLFSRPVSESFKQTDFEYDGDTEENDDCVNRKFTKKRVRTNQPISIVEKPMASDISDSTAKVSEKEHSVQSFDRGETSDENLMMNNSSEASQFTTNNVETSQSALSSSNIPESDSIVSATVDDSSDVNFISDEQTVQQKIESMKIFRNCDFSPKSLKQLQVNDPQFGNIFRYLENGDLPQSQKLARKVLLESGDFSLFDDLLFHTRVARSKRTQQFCQYQLALPEIAVKTIISLYHDSPLGGHGGIQHTVDLIREHYYFSNLAGKVSDFIKSCHACQCRKMTTRKTKAGIVAFQTPIRPFQVWEIDLFGPVPVSKSGNSYVCTAVDMFSKFIFTEPIPNSDPITVSHALYKIITQFGVFDTLISDHGSEMIGKCTKEICRLLDIKQQFTPSFTHHCLGTCERSHRTLAERITPYLLNNTNWEDFIPSIVFSMNNSVNEGTKYSPFEIIYGQRPSFPLSCVSKTAFSEIPKDYHNYIREFADKLEFIRKQVRENSEKSKISMIERANQKAHNLSLEKGDYVYLGKHPRGAAYIRVPNPCEYFMDRVINKQDTVDTASASHDNLISEQSSTNNEIQEVPNLRRSTRQRQKPIRFRDDYFVTSGTETSSASDGTLLKVKRFLAKKNHDGNTRYLAHLIGEPAQNAIWIEDNQLGPKARALLKSRPPPIIP
ncbi:unnamed protein product [Mytilus edulis]|uniref:Integrase catalytic domain-containing protein n=1 Tax=Mytilus edulis TaxID=6550 RepID=A0A8S3PLX9_MYTED|nr:unnamed protein product [Mytilus edulis]